MTTLTFKTNESNNSVSVVGNIVYGTEYYVERFNHFELEMADGSTIVYTNGPSLIYTNILFKGVTKSNSTVFENWLLNHAVLSKNTFSISGVPSSLNLGLGFGVDIPVARYNNGKTTEGVFKLVAPGNFNIVLPVKIRS